MTTQRERQPAEPWWRRRLAYLTAAGRADAIEREQLRRIEARERERERSRAIAILKRGEQ